MEGRRPGEIPPFVAWIVILAFLAVIAVIYVKLTTPPPRTEPKHGRGNRTFAAPRGTPLDARDQPGKR